MRFKIIPFFIIGLFLFPFIVNAETYGSNFLSGSCTATGSGTCANAFDSNSATLWNSATQASFPIDIRIDLGSGITKKLNKIDYISYWDSNGPYVKNVDIYGSNDDSTWYLYDSIQIPDTATDKITTSFTNTTSSAYRYYKFSTIDNWLSNGYRFGLSYDIYGYECTDCAEGGGGQSTSTFYTTFMSEQTDFMLQLLISLIFVITGIMAGYFFTKKITKK